jgi:hypothetical protein
MEIELAFAAAVINASGFAKIASTAGIPQRACDQVACALCDLWEAGGNEGLTSVEIQAIANRYVEYDDDDEAWPREMAENVVPFRR